MPLTVSQLNEYIKHLMDSDGKLANILLQGELSNYKTYPSGHHYFTLKDRNSSLRCVMFKREAASLRFRPEHGMKVIVGGRITVFPRDGQYQLYCNRMMPDGLGDLHIAFEKIKEKLEKEGLFSREHKKKLPEYPERIVLITSPVGAVVKDMIRVIGKRYPMTEIIISPVRVQGDGAAYEIANAIAYANNHNLGDLLIVGRGGGSLEDLWAFNEEVLARAIFASVIPIISAVGHEPDVTISDYVADVRASTPSHAGEIAVPSETDLYRRLNYIKSRFEVRLENKLTRGRRILDRAIASPYLSVASPILQEARHTLDYEQNRLLQAMEKAISQEKQRFVKTAVSLDALSPLKVMARGYAVPQTKDGDIIRSVKQTDVGAKIELQLIDGALQCQVTDKEK